MRRIRDRLTYANVISTLALFLVLAGGSAVGNDRANALESAGTEEALIEVIHHVGQVDVALVIQTDDRLLGADGSNAHEVHERQLQASAVRCP